jgi:hypothetical protein
VGGTDDLKDAIIKKFQRDSGLTYKRSEIMVSKEKRYAPKP